MMNQFSIMVLMTINSSWVWSWKVLLTLVKMVEFELYVRNYKWVPIYNFPSRRGPWVCSRKVLRGSKMSNMTRFSVILELYVRNRKWVPAYNFPSWRIPWVCSWKVLRGSKMSNMMRLFHLDVSLSQASKKFQMEWLWSCEVSKKCQSV